MDIIQLRNLQIQSCDQLEAHKADLHAICFLDKNADEGRLALLCYSHISQDPKEDLRLSAIFA